MKFIIELKLKRNYYPRYFFRLLLREENFKHRSNDPRENFLRSKGEENPFRGRIQGRESHYPRQGCSFQRTASRMLNFKTTIYDEAS